MPLIGPVQAAALRRNWQVFVAVAILAVFLVANQGCFRPTARRYENLVKQASALGLSLDAEESAPILPPRVFALVSENAIPAQIAQEEEVSGTLTAEFLSDLSKRTSARGFDIIVTEPVPSTQQLNSVQVRAHLRLQCRYEQFVALLDDLARGNRLDAVDRFYLNAQSNDEVLVEMWVSRYILKQTRTRK